MKNRSSHHYALALAMLSTCSVALGAGEATLRGAPADEVAQPLDEIGNSRALRQ